MCGILGTTIKNASFATAIESIVHRGPDYTGVYEDAQICMAHLLLAIRGGVYESAQPVEKSTTPWVLAFNGQLYNTESIREVLGTLAPESDVDTTLLYALIEKFGWGFIEHIHGMYAIALYNKQEKVVRLYRDQSGQKNLYYTKDGNVFSFASELRALRALHPDSKKVSRSGLAIAETIGYIPGTYTLIEGVYKLLPGEELTYSIPKMEISHRIIEVRGEHEYENETPKGAVERVVADHLQSKRDISINLSGGLDSSILFHEAVQYGIPIHAHSTYFEGGDDAHNADAILAERLAQDYGQAFTKITITKNSYLEHLAAGYTTIEEPNYNISVPVYFETARSEGISGEGMRVVLSGDGGDELFGGYPHYAQTLKLMAQKERYGTLITSLYNRLRNRGRLPFSLTDVSELFLHYRSIGQHEPTRDVALPYLRSHTQELLRIYGERSDPLYTLMLFDRYVWLANENFIRSDKLYMSQSMEMRCPFAYQPLRTYFDRHLTHNDYFRQGNNKYFLRTLYKNVLPSYITERPVKSGWRAPVALWYDDAYKKRFLEILKSTPDGGGIIDTSAALVEQSPTWPGKRVHLALSLALLITDMKLKI
jgi:asparagine synthase (glutamine-hydrolysing)